MKKRVISLCCVLAYVVAPVLAVAAQAFLSDQVTMVRHAINTTEYGTVPANRQAAKPAQESPVAL
jgi:ABC-type spermidine/putrescine transport system permease subunit II